jgi:hypothetical protein
MTASLAAQSFFSRSSIVRRYSVAARYLGSSSARSVSTFAPATAASVAAVSWFHQPPAALSAEGPSFKATSGWS